MGGGIPLSTLLETDSNLSSAITISLLCNDESDGQEDRDGLSLLLMRFDVRARVPFCVPLPPFFFSTFLSSPFCSRLDVIVALRVVYLVSLGLPHFPPPDTDLESGLMEATSHFGKKRKRREKHG